MTRTIQEIRADRDRHLAQPETRALYAFRFFCTFTSESGGVFNRFAELVEVIEPTPKPSITDCYDHFQGIHAPHHEKM